MGAGGWWCHLRFVCITSTIRRIRDDEHFHSCRGLGAVHTSVVVSCCGQYCDSGHGAVLIAYLPAGEYYRFAIVTTAFVFAPASGQSILPRVCRSQFTLHSEATWSNIPIPSRQREGSLRGAAPVQGRCGGRTGLTASAKRWVLGRREPSVPCLKFV